MAVPLTNEAKALIEGKNFAHVVTLMADGSPQVTPVWVDHDGTYVRINTAEGRIKARNLRRDPRVALSIADSENQYHYVQIRGHVVELTKEGAWEHISSLARKYMGPDAAFPAADRDRRLMIKIEPDHISSWTASRD